ncbi:hypothetical protein D7Z26_03525 [Cohnella endophytica]|uniref:DUF3939 domain-containing protein n=1 Tax=Cohnella endophytica TaxID=2419778 RepID=A0A494Y2W2_9BACL|nr:hypothetical protein [Cohnella endophytica]RKP57067.1 hypothetical protein D7Z26_03525 [Cohnella endophytica]
MKVRFLSRAVALSFMCIVMLTLSGCLYPSDQTPGNDVSARQAVLTVQDAIDRYQAQTGLLPIQNASESIPLYEKYKIDFGKLKRMGFIGQVPSAAFENGGSYQFLIIDEETKPQVKLLDLAIYQTVGGVQKKVDEYRVAHGDRNPAGDELYPGFPSVDFSKLGISSPDVMSMYSHQALNLMLDSQGRVLVDYGIDIATAVNKSNAQPKADEDMRRVLIEQSYYVPVRSPVYHWVDGEPRAVAANS